MTKALLALHVIAAIIAVGPVTVAASMFPAFARKAAAAVGTDRERACAQLAVLYRICVGYAMVAVAVPVFGLATAASLHVLTSPWLVASMALTAVAALVLGAVILPVQDRIRREVDTSAAEPAGTDVPALAAPAVPGAEPATFFDRARTSRLAMATGLFNLLWAAVTVLMILRPGSTTGV
jgi:hypothetical protein